MTPGNPVQQRPKENLPGELLTSLRAVWASQAERLSFSDEELEAARDYLLTSLPLSVLSPFSDDPRRGEKIRESLQRMLYEGRLDLPPSPEVVEALYQRVAGLGALEHLVMDPSITEIVMERYDRILVERDGVLHPTSARFGSEKEAMDIVHRLVMLMGRRISRARPLVSFNLPDGSRLSAAIPPATVSGATLCIRRFRARRFTLDDLVALGSISTEAAEWLDRALAAELNMLISGTVSTGKTTLLEALISQLSQHPCVGRGIRAVLTLEDTHELRPTYPHVRQMVTSPEVGITLRDLAVNALRMRPDVIVIGETRGAEAADMLYAMSAGISMGLTTIHAGSPQGALERMLMYVQMAGAESPYHEVPHLLGAIIAGCVDAVIHLTRLPDGARKVAAIAEVEAYANQTFSLRPVFRLEQGQLVKAPDYQPTERVARKLAQAVRGSGY